MILIFVFVNLNAATVAVNINNCVLICTKDVVMSWCIGQKRVKCTVNTKTTYDVTEQWYGISYLCVR